MNETPRMSAATDTHTPLLATKLFVPHLRPRLVPRPQLYAQLEACLFHPLTLVSAPAGFGKTTLVSMWVRTLAQPVGWLALDEGDNDLRRFLTYFVGALRQIDPNLGQSVQELPIMPGEHLDAVRVVWIIGALVNDLSAHTQPCVLILDDFHVIDSAPVLDLLRSLIAHQPPQLHLVLLTREDPALPLARLRARGQLVELRAHALRFAPHEIARFLHDVMDVALAQEEIESLDARIEGWIAGWQLAALSMQQREHPADLIAALSGNHPYILSYLAEEVLGQLPPARQDFLRQTSVLTRMTGALCDAVTGGKDGEAVLAELERANIFVVPLDEEHRWVRYHHLFANLLRHQLQRTHPDLAPVLLARASAWYEDAGQPADAVDYALAAHDYGRVVRLIETYARQVILQGYAQTVESWLRRLPEDWRMAGPRANLAFAWSLLLRGHLTQIEPYLHAAEAAATPHPNGDGAPAQIRAEINALRAGLGAVRGEGERAWVLARAAVEAAPPDDPYLQGMAYFALGTACNYAEQSAEAIDAYQKAIPLCEAAGNVVAAMLAVANLALLYRLRGQLHKAAALCRQTMAAAEQRPGPPPPALTVVYLCYSDLCYQWNDLATAQALAERWLEIGQRGGHVATIANGSVICARVYQAQGRLDAAATVLQPTVDLLQVGMPAWVTTQVIAQQITLALAQGDLAAAASWLQHPARPPDRAGHDATDVLHLAQARLLLAQHELTLSADAAAQAQLAPAHAWVDNVLAVATTGGRMARVLEALIVRSLIHQAQGNTGAALDPLARALTLAAPEGYVRIFVDEGAPMYALLQTAAKQGPLSEPAARLLAAFPPQATVDPPLDRASASPAARVEPLVELLTERELEVLRLMARGLTYQEVAEALVVSVNTVRFHVKGIYGKLGVDRRLSALERATALGLI